jgi:dephospho-CoA kinase
MVIGVTGSFATGKSSVSNMFKKLGARVIDADNIAREVLSRYSIERKIVKAFGRSVLKNDKIDRKKLASLVFNNQGLLVKLNKITHPSIIREIKKELKSGSKRPVVLDAPLLIEAGLLKLVDYLVVVSCVKRAQLRRGIKLGFKRTEVLRRIQAQLPLKYKTKLADFVVNNNFSLLRTKTEVKSIWRRIISKK